MANFFKDNADIQWHFNHLELDEIVRAKEDDFSQAETYEDAPTSVEDAREGYRAVLEMVGEIAANEIAPLAAEVDQEGARFENGKVTYAPGTQRALRILSQAGLMGFTLPRRYGGLNMPGVTYTIATELISQADASLMTLFGLQDIAETINQYADEAIKEKYLPRFASGEVTGAMVLTEPDAGSDLQSVRLKAVPQKDGTWRLYGVKRFITNGCAEVSLVLARSEPNTTDARGLSMFLVERCPELIVRRIEDKLGLHGSPTCELQFNGVPALLIGRRRFGLIRYVMSLMNGARIAIAAQAVGIAQAAYEEAVKYARARIQFKQPIVEFPQVYDLLTRMKVGVQAARAITYEASRLVDLRDAYEKRISTGNKTSELQSAFKELNALTGVLTPIAKAYASELAVSVAYDALQVHGGPGYMKDFPIERIYRDARITTIYEGTTQLQVVGALGGILSGVLGKYLHKLGSRKVPEEVSELAALCGEARRHLYRSVEFLHSLDDKTYTDYVSRKLVDMASECLACHLLMRQAAVDLDRLPVATKFARDALPRIQMAADCITSGDRFTIENREVLL